MASSPATTPCHSAVVVVCWRSKDFPKGFSDVAIVVVCSHPKHPCAHPHRNYILHTHSGQTGWQAGIETKRSHYRHHFQLHPRRLSVYTLHTINIWPTQCRRLVVVGGVTFGSCLRGFVVIQMIIISLFTPEIKSSRTSYFKRFTPLLSTTLALVSSSLC